MNFLGSQPPMGQPPMMRPGSMMRQQPSMPGSLMRQPAFNNEPIPLMDTYGQQFVDEMGPIYVNNSNQKLDPNTGQLATDQNGRTITLDPRTGQPQSFFSSVGSSVGRIFSSGGKYKSRRRGGKKRRTRGRKQRGGCNGYSSSGLAFNAAPVSGGRRKSRRHRR